MKKTLKLVRTLLNFHVQELILPQFSLCTYIHQMDGIAHFIYMGPVDLSGARRKRQNTKWN